MHPQNNPTPPNTHPNPHSYSNQNKPLNSSQSTCPEHLQQQQQLQLQAHINNLNTKLQNICSQRMGNIGMGGWDSGEVVSTIRLVEALVRDIGRLEEGRGKWLVDRRQLEMALLDKEEVIDKISKDKKSLQSQKQSLTHKTKSLQISLKQSIQKHRSQKQQLQKQLKQLQIRQKTYENEFRRKELELKEQQDRIKKYQDKPVFRNCFEVMQEFVPTGDIRDKDKEKKGRERERDIGKEGDYGRMAVQCMERTISDLTKQNNYLHECLTIIFKQLNEITTIKKESILKTNPNPNLHPNLPLTSTLFFRLQILSLPIQKSEQKIKQLIDQLTKLKQLLKVELQSGEKLENKQAGWIDGAKVLIDNYKSTINAQSQLMQKFWPKIKEPVAGFRGQEAVNAFLNEVQKKNYDISKFISDQAQKIHKENQDYQGRARKFQETLKLVQQNRAYMRKFVKNSDRESSNDGKN